MEPISLIAEATWPIRRAVLRPHQGLSEMNYPGDFAPTTRHFGLGPADRPWAVLSLYSEAPPDGALGGWRIRGMAVDPEHRGKGGGRLLLAWAVQHCRTQGGLFLWCNARSTATGFYEKAGFHIHRGPFPLPGIGDHFEMRLRL